MRTLIIFLVFVSLSSAQDPFKQLLFTSANGDSVMPADTVGTISLSDSVEIRMGYNGPWKLLTQSVNDTALITGDDKVAENTVIFNLAAESWWAFVTEVTFRIYTTGQDTVTSFPIFIPKLADGAASLFIIADTVGTHVDYGKSYIEGN